MKKLFYAALILGFSLSGTSANAAVTTGSKCSKEGIKQTYKNTTYTCIKVGKKLVWNKGVAIAPTPVPSASADEIFSPIAVTTLKATTTGSQHSFSFTIPAANPALSQYELGYSILKREGLDPSFELDYSVPVVYKLLTNDSFKISNEEIVQIFKSKLLDGSKLSIMFRIRTNWAGSVSSWGNGVYITSDQFMVSSVKPSPTPSPSASANPFQAAAEKAAAEKAAAEKAAAEKAAAEKAAAEKAAAEKAAANQIKYCDLKLGCKVGEIGPGGGFVFYVAPNPQSWGTYLEVADTNIQSQWCNSSKIYLTKNVADEKLKSLIGNEIGKGQGNTLMMLAGCQSGAAITATNYRGGNLSDWFLPSLMELNEVCKFARAQPTGTSTICSPTGPLLNLFSKSFFKSPVIGQYWSSSEYTSSGADGWTAWAVSFFANQWQSSENKQGLRPVIAIRAFGAKG